MPTRGTYGQHYLCAGPRGCIGTALHPAQTCTRCLQHCGSSFEVYRMLLGQNCLLIGAVIAQPAAEALQQLQGVVLS